MSALPPLSVYTPPHAGSQSVMSAIVPVDVPALVDRHFAAFLAEADHHKAVLRASCAARSTGEAGRLRKEHAASAARLDRMEAEIRDLTAGGVSPAELAAPVLFDLFWLADIERPMSECGKGAAALLSLLHRLRLHLEGCLREIVDDVLKDERRAIGETLLCRGRPAEIVKLERAA